MNNAASPETALRNFKVRKSDVFGVLSTLGMVGFAAFLALTAQTSLDQSRDVGALVNQVTEVSGRLAIANRVRLDEQAIAGGSPVVEAVAARFGMRQLTPEGLRHLFAITDKTIVPMFQAQGDAPRTAAAPVPGLTWQGDTLRNQWGGSVVVYHNDADIQLVAYTNVPKEFCAALHPDHPVSRAYMFACNDDVVGAGAPAVAQAQASHSAHTS